VKSLKFEHDAAQRVLKGEKTSTWRLYDDKDLSVNDDVQVIDKVDSSHPETWRKLGVAHIDSIIQKRLRDIQPQDYEGHEVFTDRAAMLKTYQHYYGPQVDDQTPVKIIRFTFDHDHLVVENTDDKKSTKIKDIKLYADGGSRGNPGPSASGFAILDMSGNIVVKKSVYLGVTTNNQAEYQALKFGLDEAKKMQVDTVHVYMDSLLVVNQMIGIFKVKNRDLWPIHAAVKDLASHFKQVSFTHVPRELNKIADSAVNEALDEAAKKI
jgi:ribonuclease HI